MKREDVIGRVRKLLAVSMENGSSENESIQAALMAQRLIAEYDIRKDEIHGDGRDGLCECASDVSSNRTVAVNLAHVVADNFRCMTYFRLMASRKRVAVFYGYETDARAAQLTYEMLYRTMNRLANRAARLQKRLYGRSDGAYNSFAVGFLRGVSEELAIQTQALMLVTPQAVRDGFEEVTRGFAGRTARAIRYNRAFTEEGRRAAHEAIREHRLGAGSMAVA